MQLQKSTDSAVLANTINPSSTTYQTIA